MASAIAIVVPWYLAIQLCAAAALPLGLRFFQALPDRGYAFAKILGPFLVGVTLWLGTSYGLLRNEFGGAWIAVAIVALLSYGFGGHHIARAAWHDLRGHRLRYVVVVEALFFITFVAWAWVRAHDPAANHTEQPMDLMFMNSIWTSPTFPPRDAWLAGYAISYYYLGYWLLSTLGQISSIPPSLAFNVGQASWYGVLLTVSFGLGYNLFALSARAQADETQVRRDAAAGAPTGFPLVAGFLTSAFVGVIGNLQVVFEWLYAQGVSMQRVAAWLAVNGFPTNAQTSGKWYIGYDWWWWRSSRVLSDQDLLGNHIEVIDEFPMFSYILGDNHPHVLAMPVVVLVIGMALTVYLGASRAESPVSGQNLLVHSWRRALAATPMGIPGLILVTVVSGGLVFLNTWDYPPYWLLLTGTMFVGLSRSAAINKAREVSGAALTAAVFGATLIAGTIAVYLPYFMTAQSQAGGFLPNLLNPSRLQQVLLMFGVFVPAILGMVFWYGRSTRPAAKTFVGAAALVLGLPLAFLFVSAILVNGTQRGQTFLSRVALPEGASSHVPFIVERWTTRPYTFLLFGLMLAVCVAIIWRSLFTARGRGLPDANLFALLVAALGILLVYLPEFIYLRDNFGTRMNTIFKFYYQAWLLMAIAAAFVVAVVLSPSRMRVPVPTRVLGALTVAGAAAALLFPVAGVYSKTAGFALGDPTLDATSYVVAENPAEMAAVNWVLTHTDPDDIVLEGKGASYRAAHNRISALTGRSTLLGWEGHESQWRGKAYAEMSVGRVELLERIYSTARPEEIRQLLDQWNVEYVYVGPAERLQYGITPRSEERLAEAMEVVFNGDGATIYQRR